MFYLHCLCRLQRLLRWDAHLPLPQELLGEVGNVSSCDGNVLYTAANYVTFSLRHRRSNEKMNNVQQNKKYNPEAAKETVCSFYSSSPHPPVDYLTQTDADSVTFPTALLFNINTILFLNK